MYEQYEQSFAQRQAQVRHAVETASGVLTWAEQQEANGTWSGAQAQAMASAAIAKMRYGYGEYFWINNLEGTIVMHPIRPELARPGW